VVKQVHKKMANVRVTSRLAGWLQPCQHWHNPVLAGNPHNSVHSHFTTQQGPSVVVRSWLHSHTPLACFLIHKKLPTIKWPGMPPINWAVIG
jgi:hypothetical protein